MKRNMYLAITAIIVFFAVPQHTNAQFLKQLGKLAENVGKAIIESPSDNNTQRDYSTTTPDGIKVVTGHPDFKIKVNRCVASDKTVLVEMTLLNAGRDDIDEIRICLGNGGTTVHDSEGNEYIGGYDDPVWIKISNRDYDKWVSDFSLVSGVPTRATWKIEGVPTYVHSIARIQFGVDCKKWGLDRKCEIRNIPITRE